MKLSVILPSYQRPQDLERCFQGLQRQNRLPDEVVLIVHQDDLATQELAQRWTDWSPLKVVVSAQKGQVTQLNLGLANSTGEVVAITDDDAVPQPMWLALIEQHFTTHSDLGGVGGRDIVHEDGKILTGNAQQIGSVQWFGRIIGNHHIGGRMVSRVDILKGANMAYRTAAIDGMYFDTDLRGQGAQICNDMAFSLELGKRGWRLMYDPAVAVDHYPAQRFDKDDRRAPSQDALYDRAFNLYLSIRRHMRPGVRRYFALAWAGLVGVRYSPGALRGLVARLRHDTQGSAAREAARQAWKAAQKCAVASSVHERAA